VEAEDDLDVFEDVLKLLLEELVFDVVVVDSTLEVGRLVSNVV